jgi:hypothetical protein
MHGMPPTWFLLLAIAALLAPVWWPFVVAGVCVWLYRSRRPIALGIALTLGVVVELVLFLWVLRGFAGGY